MNEIEQVWKEYRWRVVPLDATEYQVIESRRAFYAGAAGLIKMALHSTSKSQAEAARDMSSLRKECERFQAEVAAGRA